MSFIKKFKEMADKQAYPDEYNYGMTYREWLVGQAIAAAINTGSPEYIAECAINLANAVVRKLVAAAPQDGGTQSLEAALPAQGWSEEPPAEPGYYWWHHEHWHAGCREPRLMHLAGRAEHFAVLGGVHSGERPADMGGWWLRIPMPTVPTPPNAEPGERSGE